MAAKNIRDALKRAINQAGLREFQYENYIIHFTFERSLIEDELVNAIRDVLQNRQKRTLTDPELRALRNTARKVARRAYSRKNIIKAHKRQGYKIYKGKWSKVKARMARDHGYTRDKQGRPQRIVGPKQSQLGVYVPGAGAGLQFLRSLITNVDSVPVSYVASFGTETRQGGPNQKLHKQMWANAVYRMWKELGSYAGVGTGRQTNKNPSGPMVGNQRTSIIGAKQGRQSRYRRLHGPVASGFQGPPLESMTGLEAPSLGDTSVAVVGMVEALRDLGPDSVINEIPPYQEMYTYAYQDILHELDINFKINGQSISDIINFDKTIEIGMALGGDIHQGMMSPADKLAVEKKLDEIVDIMINDNSWNTDYVTSKGFSQRGGELVGALVIKELLNKSWWKKPNMRLKVNKQLALLGRREKEASKALQNQILAGSSKLGGIKKARKKGSRRSKVRNTARVSAKGQAHLSNPLALRNLINSVLPQMVAMKMQPPALRYRTGRFANSARVTQVMQGPRGGLQADYTYMRNPYETFEPGGDMGSTQRDPRKIIGESIREIVATAMQNKFIKTRRV